jgi:hypothetical protein
LTYGDLLDYLCALSERDRAKSVLVHLAGQCLAVLRIVDD